MNGQSSYESWVTTLVAWREDPAVPLSELPVLTEESLPRDAFDRLFKHLEEALEHSTQRWEKTFSAAISDYRNHHDLADRLVKLRAGLARRLQLASHPSLPEPVRTALTDDFERMVHRLQEQFESNTRAALIRSRVPHSAMEQLMRTIHENPLDEVLRLKVSQDGERATVEALPETGPDATAQPTTLRRRRVLASD